MIGSMIITGGILYAGVSTYNRLDTTREKPPSRIGVIWENLQNKISRVKQTKEKSKEKAVVIEYEIEQQQKLDRNLTLAGTALGLTTLSALVFPPLRLASIPILIYMGVPSAQAAYDDLAENCHIGLPFVETGLLVLVLAQGIYMTGSIGFIAYYLGRILKTNMPNKAGAVTPQITVWRNGTQMKLSVDRLQEKDIFQVNTGEKVHVDGIVVDGIALVDLQWATGEQTSVTKKIGSKIPMSTVISVGKLWVEYCGT